MLVGKWMTKDPVVIEANATLETAKAKMEKGNFRRLPVVEGSRLVGILTDRDLRKHSGYLERTKVNVAMTEKVVTVTPATMLERATQLLLKHKVGGLPVMDDGKLVGIITTIDMLRAFSDRLGASEEGVSRIDLAFEGDTEQIVEITQVVAEEIGEVFGLGTYRSNWQDSGVFYVRVRSDDARRMADMLKEKGYTVLGVHS